MTTEPEQAEIDHGDSVAISADSDERDPYFEPPTERSPSVDGYDIPDQVGRGDRSELGQMLAHASDLAMTDKFDEAVPAFQMALAKDPGNPEAMYGLAFCQRRLGELGSARITLESALKQHPDDPTLLTEQGILLAANGDHDAAVDKLVRALEIEPNLQGIISLSAALRANGQPERAQSVVEQWIADPPTLDQVALVIELGWALGDQDRHEEALEAFESALEWAPTNIDALRWRSTELRILGRYAEAEAAMRAALEHDPDNAALTVELGWALDAQEEHDRALAAFERALELEPANLEAIRWKATELRFLGRIDEAADVLVQRLADDDTNVGLHIELGWVRSSQLRHDEALSEFERAIDLQGDAVDALRWRTRELTELGRFDEAESSAREALATAPGKAPLRIELGSLLHTMGRSDEAIAEFDQVLLTDPYNVEALLAKTSVHRSQRESSEAVEQLRAGLEAHPESLELADSFGWVLIDLDELDAARSIFESAIRTYVELHPGSDPDPDVSLAGRGAVGFASGDYFEAETLFRRALESDQSAPSLANLAWAIVLGSDQLDKERRAEVTDLCRRAVVTDPGYGSAYGCRAMLAYRHDDRSTSERWYLKMIEADPDHASYADLGALYNTLHRYNDAEVQLTKALELRGDDAQAMVEMGNLNILQNKHAEGAIWFRRALEVRPKDRRATRALAGAMANCAQMVEAERLLLDGIKDPGTNNEDKWKMHVLLGRILLRRAADTGEGLFYKQALDQAQQAIIIKPDSPWPQWLAAQAHWGMAAESKDPSRSARRHARRHAQAVLAQDNTNFEAALMVERAGDQLKDTRALLWGQVAIVAVSLALLVVTWTAFLVQGGNKGSISEGTVLALTPLLAGLIVVGVLLPVLTGLKVGGLEAQFRQIQEAVLEGPQGDQLQVDSLSSSSTLDPVLSSQPKGSKRAGGMARTQDGTRFRA